MMSRGTTIGELNEQGKRMDSAIYYHDFGLGLSAIPLSSTRLAELRGPVGNSGNAYSMIRKRDKWVAHLENNSHSSGLTEAQIYSLFEWVRNTRIQPERVEQWVQKITAAYRPDVP
jgi:hypothetical protein